MQTDGLSVCASKLPVSSVGRLGGDLGKGDKDDRADSIVDAASL